MLPLPAFAPALYLLFSLQLSTLSSSYKTHMFMELNTRLRCVCVWEWMRNQASTRCRCICRRMTSWIISTSAATFFESIVLVPGKEG
ncbi:hypothetical protein VIGAN_06177900 [Vigna angularis var. angularis]|uniref:Secreted protein n=1 Tax=Vigna angularis var. angularis TaxID=157739 RepID=A0A0S3SCP2_PHAAN|nr:hypothetical protein VIGAN_06177900 [Vigna angularis var. angularis]